MGRFGTCLVVTYGRSGSTLLQGILNTIPGWLIRGENENFPLHLFRMAGAIRTAQAHRFPHETPADPWYGVQEIDLGGVMRDCEALIRNALVPLTRRAAVRCYGFKEIRCVYIPGELRTYLDFLHDVLPGLVVIFNFRDIDAVLRSAWWRDADPVQTRALIDAFERAAIGYHVEGRAPSLIVRYEELTRRGAALRGLFDFLGETMDDALLDEVFRTTHSTRTEATDQLSGGNAPALTSST